MESGRTTWPRESCAVLLVGFTMAFLSVLAPDPTDAQTDEPRKEASESYYVVLFSRGPGYVESVSPTQQPGMARHREFVTRLNAEGVIPLGGPLFSDAAKTRISGILYFVIAASPEEARSVVMKEPFVQEKVVVIDSVQAFLPAFTATIPAGGPEGR